MGSPRPDVLTAPLSITRRKVELEVELTMTIQITCTKCSRSYRVKDELRGKRFKCKQCADILTVGDAATVRRKKGATTPRLPAMDVDYVRIRIERGGRIKVSGKDRQSLLEVYRVADPENRKLYELRFHRPEMPKPSLTIAKTETDAFDRKFVVRRGRKKIGRIHMSRTFFFRPWQVRLSIKGRTFSNCDGGIFVSGGPSRAMPTTMPSIVDLLLMVLFWPVIVGIMYVMMFIVGIALIVGFMLFVVLSPLILIALVLGMLPEPGHFRVHFYESLVKGSRVARLTHFGRFFGARLTRLNPEFDMTVCTILSVLRVIGELRTIHYHRLDEMALKPADSWSAPVPGRS